MSGLDCIQSRPPEELDEKTTVYEIEIFSHRNSICIKMSNYQVIIRALPIDAEVTPDLLRPQDIDPHSPLYKKTNPVGDPEGYNVKIPDKLSLKVSQAILVSPVSILKLESSNRLQKIRIKILLEVPVVQRPSSTA
ncbi:hypothetical protein CEXT_755601 [Caerostris extrusa]|uniref:Uncharacterized protein n=1 Tax=Caerostris extrusa TaxID=172846 RepID=A0AAV4Y4M2_CAEEX|nr:hypothetical protein CEXT_755601 [Caerostris extrusa]